MHSVPIVPCADCGRLRPAEAGRAPGSIGSPAALPDEITCLAGLIASEVGAGKSSPEVLGAATACVATAEGAADNVGWTAAEPERPDEVPGRPVPVTGV